VFLGAVWLEAGCVPEGKHHMTETVRGSAVVRSLVATHAYSRQTEPYTLSSGVTSYDYIDAKQILLVNEFQAQIGAEMARVIDEHDVSYAAVGGLELGAIYVAQALLVHEWLVSSERASSFVVRKKAKKHGKGLKIEGPSVKGESVVVVDDVVTTGESIIRAVDALRDEGADVALAITLVDRGDTAAELLSAIEIPYHPLTTYRDYGIEPVRKPETPVVEELSELRSLRLPGTDRIPDLISWCWDEADNSGDSRYAGIARALDAVLDAWDVKGGLPESTLARVNELLSRHLAEVLSTPEPAAGSAEARWMRDQIAEVLELGSTRDS
jgi:orotate phosphoribosyltransferase